ncbi:TetR/AcrR family transcriptional regulator [Nocardia bovistercoris]|uniref:TetR/AcrR family transcriptional regulator n=1 Tax=Nocardia bovistercoris TaxID=2785916 RepID=A0A931I4L5_9NOCA|nr:TetR/AcrR family transcriptional regulator [Nocardia bovistercoris]MBH0774777.1 TetR/AcrR family transcriptional regulator [Nocardia bovistercoris]
MPPSPPTIASAKGRARHDTVLDTAAVMFAQAGAAHVTLAEVAKGAGLTPSGIYRYFGDKHDLFVAVIDRCAHVYLRAVTDLGPDADPDSIARAVVSRTARDPIAAANTLREARYLPDDATSPQFDRFRRIWANALRHERGEIADDAARYLVTAALGVLAGTLGRKPPARVKHLALELIRAITAVELADVGTRADDSAASPSSDLDARREATLRAAARLFRRHGFPNVGIDDIGAEVGMSGAAIYRHFRGKDDLLVTAFRRTGDRFIASASAALTEPARTPADTLAHLIRAYTAVACDNRDLVHVYIHEARSLPPRERRDMAAIQDALVKIWIDTARLIDPARARPDLRTTCLGIIGALNACAVGDTGTTEHAVTIGLAAAHTLTPTDSTP